MAVQTSHARGVHLTSEKCREFIILVMNLTISIKELAVVHRRQVKMVKEVCARFEIAGDITPPRMTGSTHILGLSGG